MGEKRACSLCGEELEDEPAVHDLAKCEKTELLKGRVKIKALTESLYQWKYGEGGWFHQRDIIGRLSWQHLNCPHEKDTHMDKKIDVFVGGKLVASVLSPESEAAVLRLMAVKTKDDQK